MPCPYFFAPLVRLASLRENNFFRIWICFPLRCKSASSEIESENDRWQSFTG